MLRWQEKMDFLLEPSSCSKDRPEFRYRGCFCCSQSNHFPFSSSSSSSSARQHRWLRFLSEKEDPRSSWWQTEWQEAARELPMEPPVLSPPKAAFPSWGGM